MWLPYRFSGRKIEVVAILRAFIHVNFLQKLLGYWINETVTCKPIRVCAKKIKVCCQELTFKSYTKETG